MWLGRYVALIVFLAPACRGEKLIQARDPLCDQTCFSGNPVQAGIGNCVSGKWSCDENGKLAACVGSVLPAPRACNGQDNDCDGLIDSLKLSCSTPCGTGFQTCYEGRLEPCSARESRPEVCNNFDDDCDGVTDEIEDLPADPCYTGPKGAVRYGECRYGTTRCFKGKVECIGEILPLPRETCNGKDDNCDGRVDEGLTGKPFDFVFILDESGSMDEPIWRLIRATSAWSSKYASRADMRFALVLAPGGGVGADEKVSLLQDFTDAGAFAAVIAAQAAGNTSLEPTLNALFFVAQDSNQLRLSWRPNSTRAAILFSDEEAQSYPAGTTPADVAAAASLTKTLIVVFAPDEYFFSYRPAANELLDYRKVDVSTELDRIFKETTCQ